MVVEEHDFNEKDGQSISQANEEDDEVFRVFQGLPAVKTQAGAHNHRLVDRRNNQQTREAAQSAIDRREESKQQRTQAKIRPSTTLATQHGDKKKRPFQETFGLFRKSESYDIEDDEATASRLVPNCFPAEDRYTAKTDTRYGALYSAPKIRQPADSQPYSCSSALQGLLDRCPDVGCCHGQALSDPDEQVKLSQH